MSSKLLMFQSAATSTEALFPAEDRVVSGHPAQTIRNHFSDASGQFFAGEWTGEIGKWKVHYSEEEFCYVTRGKVLVTDSEGDAIMIGAGDAFVVPSGFSGSWDVIEPVHKYYVIFESKKA